MSNTSYSATQAQRDTLTALAPEGIAQVWEERGTFFDGTQRFYSRLRVSTDTLHDFGILILNPDGRLWNDGGDDELMRIGR